MSTKEIRIWLLIFLSVGIWCCNNHPDETEHIEHIAQTVQPDAPLVDQPVSLEQIHWCKNQMGSMSWFVDGKEYQWNFVVGEDLPYFGNKGFFSVRRGWK